LLSSFCDDSNLHISLFKYVLSTMGVSKESISKFLLIDSLLTPIVESTYLSASVALYISRYELMIILL